MNEILNKKVTIMSKHLKLEVTLGNIAYCTADLKDITIYLKKGSPIPTRMTISTLEQLFGEYFIKISRNCLVAMWSIMRISGSEVILYDKTRLPCTESRLPEIRARYTLFSQELIRKTKTLKTPVTDEEFSDYFKPFDCLPIAFAVIEILFDDEKSIDFEFRYGNRALALLENRSLDEMIGKSFCSVFKNADEKWLSIYERAALFGEFIQVFDYSPEIKKNLRVICYQPFHGYCGCFLYDLKDISDFREISGSAKEAMMYYLEALTLNCNQCVTEKV